MIEERAPGGSSGPTVLIVDADTVSRDAAARALVAHGYQVVTTGDGLDGLDRAEAKQPDVLVAAGVVPRLRGLELVRRVKAKAHGVYVPALVLVSDPLPSARADALRGGADAVLGRPFDVEELLATVEALLRRGRLEGRTAESDRGRPLPPAAAAVPMEPPSADQAGEPGQLRPFLDRVAEVIRRAHRRNETAALLLLASETAAASASELPVEVPRSVQALAQAAHHGARPADVVAPADAHVVGVLSLGLQLAGAVEVAERVLAEVLAERGRETPTYAGLALYPGRAVSTAEELERYARMALARAIVEGPGSLCLALHSQVYVLKR